MFKPVEVTPLHGYKIRIRYANGVEGDVDLSHLVGQGVFSRWSDPNAFENVCIGPSGEIKWSDEVELCSDSLYMEITGKSPEEVFPNLLKAKVNAGDQSILWHCDQDVSQRSFTAPPSRRIWRC